VRIAFLRTPLLSGESGSNLEAYREQLGQKNVPLSEIAWKARRWHAPLATRRYRRCAGVGSSSSLLDDENGDEIDSCDLILRANSPPTLRGFERHVGSRTDVHVDEWFYLKREHRGDLRGTGVPFSTCRATAQLSNQPWAHFDHSRFPKQRPCSAPGVQRVVYNGIRGSEYSSLVGLDGHLD
jgi:hypothetical protein